MIPLVAGREEAEPDVTITEGVAPERGKEECLPPEHPVTSMETGPPSAPDVSPTQRASSSSSCHYSKLLFARNSQSSAKSLATSQLNYCNHMFFAGLFPLPGDMESFYDRVLSAESDIFDTCAMSWLKMKRNILEVL